MKVSRDRPRWPKGFRVGKAPDFLTFRHYKGGRSLAKHTGRRYPRRNLWSSLSEAESTSGHMVLSGVPRKKSPLTPPGIDPGTSRLVAQCLNHYATPGPIYTNTFRFSAGHVFNHYSLSVFCNCDSICNSDITFFLDVAPCVPAHTYRYFAVKPHLTHSVLGERNFYNLFVIV